MRPHGAVRVCEQTPRYCLELVVRAHEKITFRVSIRKGEHLGLKSSFDFLCRSVLRLPRLARTHAARYDVDA